MIQFIAEKRIDCKVAITTKAKNVPMEILGIINPRYDAPVKVNEVMFTLGIKTVRT